MNLVSLFPYLCFSRRGLHDLLEKDILPTSGSMDSGQTDSMLLDALVRGDKPAFETIYHRYAADLNRYAFQKTGDRDDGEEIVQNLFVWLWINRQKLEKVTDIRSYLFHSAKNRILNHYRATRVRQKYADSLAAFEVTYDHSTEQELELTELKEAIEKSLADLPEKCQTAFRLSRMHNLPISDIAKEMAISRRTVENYISRALKHLREEVNKEQD